MSIHDSDVIDKSETSDASLVEDSPPRPEFFTRHFKMEDADDLLQLLRSIAAKPGGFVRMEEEISADFVDETLKRSLNGGASFGAIERGSGRLLGVITSRKLALKAFEHVLSSVMIGVHPEFQSRGIGRRLFVDFLEYVTLQRDDIKRIELIARDSNQRQISFYESMGFRREGVFEKRFRRSDGSFEADIPMGWSKD